MSSFSTAGQNPLPQTLILSNQERDFWGDSDVYGWCLEIPPHTIALALTSLRYWLDDYLKTRDQEEDPARVFDIVLSQSNSFAVVAVCVMVASEDFKKRARALLPILEQPAFWAIDGQRLARMVTFDQRDNLYTFVQFAQYILLAGEQDEREKLQAALKRFPTNIPFFSEEEKRNTELVTRRQQYMEQIAAFGDLENYTFKEHEDGVFVEFNFPGEIEQRRQQELRKTKTFQTEISLNLHNWAYLVTAGKQPETLSLEQAIILAKELDTADEPYDERVYGTVAETCGALVLNHYDWLKENGHLEWCRKKLFDAIHRKDPDTETFDPITGPFHIVARALPALVVNDPADNDARQAIWDLIAASKPHLVNTAVQHVFEGLQPLWQIDPDYLWQCYNLLVAKVKIILSNRKRANTQNNAEIEAEIRIELIAKAPKLSLLDVGFVYLLSPLVVGIPKLPEFAHENSDARILELIDEIIALNNEANKHSQMTARSREHRLFQVPHEWEEPLYERLASWVLHLPFDMACEHILVPIISVWEEGAGALGKLLNRILIEELSSAYEERFLQIWKYTIPRIMQTETVQQNPQGGRNTDLKLTYPCLVLMARYEIEVWKERDWNPSPNLVTELALWVEKLGHYHDNFSTLVRMLRSVGKPIVLPHGINWLFEAFQRAEEPHRLFATSRDLSALSQLLLDIWFEHGDLSSGDQTLFQRFTFLVDYLASKGEQIAVELQRKMQT